MSTHAVTTIFDGKEALVSFYRHMDGYPSWHGKELFEFLDGMKIVNGLGGDVGKVANGMDCLAAQLIAHFKDGPGNIYITRNEPHSEDYSYDIFLVKDKLQVKVYAYHKKIFSGSVKSFGKFCNEALKVQS